ncbi:MULTISPECIES: GNAT family N-acetyltransferase [unclassified Streptomyces]|uniref:GNAT family N-acetyltransferase n=1 Tax=unclassified Streptomyces TaxID=2593676 RepID=UPI0038229BA7
MRSDDWQIAEDIDDFLARAGGFLRSRPGLHTTMLSTTERLRTRASEVPDAQGAVLGLLEDAGGVRAAYYRLPARGLGVTSLTPAQADTLAAHLVSQGQSLPWVSADEGTAGAFAEAWRRHTGAAPALRNRLFLYRLGTLTPPEPFPAGRGRLVGEQERGQLMRWCAEFAADVREDVTIDAASWAGTRFAEKRYTFWETPDGTPVSMAGANPLAGGQIRVDPVYTPAAVRGRGYAGAVTAEVSRAALAAGAEEVVLYTDPANRTSNALYRRIGYELLTAWAVYDFAGTA